METNAIEKKRQDFFYIVFIFLRNKPQKLKCQSRGNVNFASHGNRSPLQLRQFKEFHYFCASAQTQTTEFDTHSATGLRRICSAVFELKRLMLLLLLMPQTQL